MACAIVPHAGSSTTARVGWESGKTQMEVMVAVQRRRLFVSDAKEQATRDCQLSTLGRCQSPRQDLMSSDGCDSVGLLWCLISLLLPRVYANFSFPWSIRSGLFPIILKLPCHSTPPGSLVFSRTRTQRRIALRLSGAIDQCSNATTVRSIINMKSVTRALAWDTPQEECRG